MADMGLSSLHELACLMATIRGRENYYSHFPDEEMGIWREYVTFPRSP